MFQKKRNTQKKKTKEKKKKTEKRNCVFYVQEVHFGSVPLPCRT